jgi:hypothetical protein
MGIAQGILTNQQSDLTLTSGVSVYGVFGGDMYSETISYGMPISIDTTIRMIGIVPTIAPNDVSDTLEMRIVNITQGTNRGYGFMNWLPNSLNTRAITPLDIDAGDVIYVRLTLTSAFSVGVRQVLCIYDLQTP